MPILRPLILLALLAVGPSLALAQAPAGAAGGLPPGFEPDPASAPVAQPKHAVHESVNFAGTNLRDMLDFFVDKDPSFQAILLPTTAGEQVVPPLKLRNVTAVDVLNVLRGVDLGGFTLAYEPVDVNGSVVYRVSVSPMHEAAPGAEFGGLFPRPAEQPQTRVFPLPPGFDPQKLLPVLDELANTVAGDADKPVVKLHKESGILIARGSKSQLDAFNDLIGALGNGLPSKEQYDALVSERATLRDELQQERAAREVGDEQREIWKEELARVRKALADQEGVIRQLQRELAARPAPPNAKP